MGEVAAALSSDRISSRLEREPTTTLAVLRSILTHPEAAAHLRTAAAHQSAQISSAIPAPDAELRAALIEALIIGMIVGRYQIKLPGLHDASPNSITGLLRPFIETLTTGTTSAAADRTAPPDRDGSSST